jgi:hypothetical protein
MLEFADRSFFDSGRAQPHSTTLPRSSKVFTNSARFWSAAVLCRYRENKGRIVKSQPPDVGCYAASKMRMVAILLEEDLRG